MNSLDFRSPVDIQRIKELEERVQYLSDKVKLAEEDMKRVLIHDYDVVCEFCAKEGCCFTLSGYDCKDKSRWRYKDVRSV